MLGETHRHQKHRLNEWRSNYVSLFNDTLLADEKLLMYCQWKTENKIQKFDVNNLAQLLKITVYR